MLYDYQIIRLENELSYKHYNIQGREGFLFIQDICIIFIFNIFFYHDSIQLILSYLLFLGETGDPWAYCFVYRMGVKISYVLYCEFKYGMHT